MSLNKYYAEYKKNLSPTVCFDFEHYYTSVYIYSRLNIFV